ncbi:hypothetical protein D3C81_1416380 [compost metagenome]
MDRLFHGAGGIQQRADGRGVEAFGRGGHVHAGLNHFIQFVLLADEPAHAQIHGAGDDARVHLAADYHNVGLGVVLDQLLQQVEAVNAVIPLPHGEVRHDNVDLGMGQRVDQRAAIGACADHFEPRRQVQAVMQCFEDEGVVVCDRNSIGHQCHNVVSEQVDAAMGGQAGKTGVKRSQTGSNGWSRRGQHGARDLARQARGGCGASGAGLYRKRLARRLACWAAMAAHNA